MTNKEKAEKYQLSAVLDPEEFIASMTGFLDYVTKLEVVASAARVVRDLSTPIADGSAVAEMDAALCWLDGVE